MLKPLSHIIEAIIAYTLYCIFWLLPIDQASALSGYLVEKIGAKLKVNKIAFRNLDLCFPNLSKEEKNEIIKKMWNNLGRIIGEMPHWYRISDKEFVKRVDIVNFPTKEELLSNYKNKVLLISAHFGNWELANRLVQYRGLKLCFIYRKLNNKYVNWLLNYTRKKTGVALLEKDTGAAKGMIREIKNDNGKTLGMLVDQRHDNNGVMIPFFGNVASTTTAPADLMLLYKTPIVIGKIIRSKGAYYKVEFSNPLTLEDIDRLRNEKSNSIDEESDKRKIIMNYINQQIESWVTANPEQWFWVHRRWPLNLYEDDK